MADITDYFIAIPNQSSELLDDWKWLLGDQAAEVFQITRFGDLFLKDVTGAIFFLDTVDGKLSAFACNDDEFYQKLRDRHYRQRYLCSFLLRDLLSKGIALSLNECYSPGHPPVLGGNFAVDNLQPTDVFVHTSMMGQIHRQVRDLPTGTPISSITLQ